VVNQFMEALDRALAHSHTAAESGAKAVA